MHLDRAAAGALIVGFAVHGLIDGTFYHALPLALTAACLAIALRPDTSDRSVAPPGPATPLLPALATGAAGVVIVLHTAVVFTVGGDRVPDPGSPGDRLVHWFPSNVSARTLRPWLNRREAENPDLAIDLARWAQRHARRPWWFYHYEADKLASRDPEAAAAALREAIRHAVSGRRPQLEAEYRRRFATSGSMGQPADTGIRDAAETGEASASVSRPPDT